MLTVRFSEVKGGPAGDLVELRITGAQMVTMNGQFEPDWFLSAVFCVDNLGNRLAVSPGAALSLGRLVVLATNGAFLEVVGGQLQVIVSRSVGG